MKKLLRKPAQFQSESTGRFEKFKLIENPFPSEPVINKDSKDKRINGDIFELEIRKKEYEQIVTSFLKVPQSNPTHLRLGFIIDTSYIGRGNGKSAFLVNLQQNINKDYCLDISDDLNKCFAIYITPEPGGRTKTFLSFVDLFFKFILNSDIIKYCLASLRLDAIYKEYPDIEIEENYGDENNIISNLNSEDWFREKDLNSSFIDREIWDNEILREIPPNFPLFQGKNRLYGHFINQDDFERYYMDLRRDKDKLDFIFSHMVRFFQAAGFNGAYVLVDDFERIPDFQSERQKKDFALELRSCLFDGLYVNSKIGFYNFFLVLHAGVERLISDAWAGSGMENRAPISPKTPSKHIIHFEKLSREHASLLIKKYLEEYRVEGDINDPLFPFTEGAVKLIGELSEYNAAKILKMSYDLLDKAAEIENQKMIDERFVTDYKMVQKEITDRPPATIENAESTDLIKKAEIQE